MLAYWLVQSRWVDCRHGWLLGALGWVLMFSAIDSDMNFVVPDVGYVLQGEGGSKKAREILWTTFEPCLSGVTNRKISGVPTKSI